MIYNYKFTFFFGLLGYFLIGYQDIVFFIFGVPILLIALSLLTIYFYSDKFDSNGNGVMGFIILTIVGLIFTITSIQQSLIFYFKHTDNIEYSIIFISVIFILIVAESLFPLLFKIKKIDYYKYAQVIPGEEVNVEEYLYSDDYYSKYTLLWWVYTKQVNESITIRTSQDVYWTVDDTYMFRTNKNGSEMVSRIKFCKDDSDLLNQDVIFDLSYFISDDPRGGSPEENHYLINGMYADGSDIESDKFIDINDECEQLFHENKYLYVSECLDGSSTSVYDNVLFKHGNSLLNSRELEDKNWFHHYSLSYVDEEEGLSAIEKVYFENDEEGPYLWWRTKNIPEKSEHVAYQDNRRNSFYVKNGTNLGVCVVHDGKTLSDQRVELRLFFDGYFNIKVKYC